MRQGRMIPISLAALLFFFTPFAAHAWEIVDFRSDIRVEESGTVLVVETIAADFGQEEKHGIFRDLPLIYEGTSGEHHTRITDIGVEQDESPAETHIEREGSWMRIRIGDPDATITGLHTYRISYRIAGALQRFSGYDELYWNVTGNDWDAPIRRASATVTIPADILQYACYQGAQGSTATCDSAQADASTASFSTMNLSAREGLTVAIGFTQGMVPILTVEPPPSIFDALRSPVTLLVAIFSALIGILAIARTWWLYGRDRFWQRSFLPGVRSDRDSDLVRETILPLRHAQPISVEYDSPDGLRPAEIGVLLDERANTLDVSATIVDLASRGYLEITEVPKTWLFGSSDYVFKRTDTAGSDLLPYESLLLKHLFESGNEVAMSSLKQTFYDELQAVKKELYKEVVGKKLFAANPSHVRTAYLLGGFVLIAAGFIGSVAASVLLANVGVTAPVDMLLGLSVGVGISGIVLLIVSPFMPRKSGYGRELYQRALGYKLFVSGTEKYRAKFYEDTNLFVAVLPYAIVFGVTDKLANAFKEMGLTPPSPGWYHGTHAFNPAIFAGSMNEFSKSMGSAMASTPSGSGSGGGGFSGGGFGGGGGGSW